MEEEDTWQMKLDELSSKSFTLKINHSKTKTIPIGQCINSRRFNVGGHEFSICYFPQGRNENKTDKKGEYVSIYLKLLSSHSNSVKAKLSLMTIQRKRRMWKKKSMRFNMRLFPWSESLQGVDKFIPVGGLESLYLNDDDCLLIHTQVTVFGNSVLEEPTRRYFVSPLDLHKHIVELWERKENTDVRFDVNREIFHAHKLMLSARSPVFRAAFSSSMVEANSTDCIKIIEMDVSVFRTLLHFIYTDMVPDMMNGSDILSLFNAADRYDVQGLRTICEKMLRERISLDNVMETLDFAARHYCDGLKDDCIEYITLPQNFSLLAVTKEYGVIYSHESLLEELQEKVKYWHSQLNKTATN